MEPLALRESYIIDCREIWPSPMARLSIETEAVSNQWIQTNERKRERKKERKKEDSTLEVVTHRKNSLLGFDRPKTIILSIPGIANYCCIYEFLLHCIASSR